jgi:uncharacterized delta-60 repeat protein
LLADGKILAAGYFYSVNGAALNRLVRLNADGSVDGSFNTGSGFDDEVSTILVQPDGKVVVGGWFSNYNGMPQKQIARLNANGSLDRSFTASGSGDDLFDYQVITSLTGQPDAKVLVGGLFNTLNGVPRKNLGRLFPDGRLDETFNVNDSISTPFIAPVLQPDGKLLVVSYNKGKPVVRLNPDGTSDPTFAMEGVPPGEGNIMITRQPDHKLLVSTAGRLSRFAVLQSQTIAFPPIPDKLTTDAPFTVSATASSGLPVTFAVVSGPATVAGNTLTVTGPGTVTVRATQAGDGSYAAAAAVEQTFKVEAVLSVEDPAAGLRLYPNPATGVFWVGLPNRPAGQIRLFNAQGRAVRIGTEPATDGVRVDARDLPAGLYVLYLEVGETQLSRKVILK